MYCGTLVGVYVCREKKDPSFDAFSSLNFIVYSTCRRDVKYIKNSFSKSIQDISWETEAYIAG
jgi:hypothetical protein